MRPLKNICEVAVIGGGLAGLAAARHAARLGRLVTLFEGTGMFGGQVATTNEVDGVPVPGKFSGQDLAIHLLEDARKVAVQVVEAGVAKIELNDRLTLDGSGPQDLPSRGDHHCFRCVVAQTRRSQRSRLRRSGPIALCDVRWWLLSRPGCRRRRRRGQRCARGAGARQDQPARHHGVPQPAESEARLRRETRSTRECHVCLGQRSQRDPWRGWRVRRARAQCEGRHQHRRRVHGFVSVHRRSAEHRIRSCSRC